jgi:thiol:disulfide interchange protein DsbC
MRVEIWEDLNMKFLLSVGLGFWFCVHAFAIEPDEVRKKLKKAIPRLAIETIVDSRIEGLYEVRLDNGSVIQFSKDGEHFIYGDIYHIGEKLVNITDENRNVHRKKMLDAVDESDMIVFAPRNAKSRANITVFTDIDCGYCRRLHADVPELNQLGVTVRYLAFPRTGIFKGDSTKTASYKKLASAWCSDNRQLALTMAKTGTPIEDKDCENPVASHYALGEVMQVDGTPAILYDDGKLDIGYRTPAQLATRLGFAPQ